ncbi:Glutaredoxin 4 isoform 1 [Hibiscus syriacus]|uniref:Glutaredoxin 4 isoform 1 n=1 Tax=Hibiscus syriacus TaxID=106335 RepID=A0A6A3AA38_HIBSY|nr:uncharacterized protein LOC120131891 [Hibiscus syriacus]XP_039004695.1 uncharacterized protein LOC120131891 [Hibiscus syriacus]XP_039004696.1 uncharacterized protein LOC120131891 [Hibiscus syriacus]KAE8700627.1 Glutaredoxin 4 isoform 1 [Hibiscus syriacus]
MPKDRRVGSLSFQRSRISPYPCSSKDRDAKQCHPDNPLGLGFGSAEDVKEWEDARCPICMEHPHNAVLLRCSSFEKGCLPFMCNTSYRHSNCLDQFCKSSLSSPSTAVLQEIPLGNPTSTSIGWRNPPFHYHQTDAGSDIQQKLFCPLCRGDIYGWSVVESARHFMNSKVRSCSSETCDFGGTYSELRKHARSAHPLVRPSEVDPERQRDWTRLERERDYEDMLSSIQPVAGEESNGESLSDLEDFRSWLTINLAYLTLALEFISDSRGIEDDNFRRRLGNRRFRYDRESDHGTRENNSSAFDQPLLGHRNNPMPEERLPGRHRASQGILQWRNSSSTSDRVSQGRRRSSQADRTRRGQGGLRWRTPRWSSNNGQ